MSLLTRAIITGSLFLLALVFKILLKRTIKMHREDPEYLMKQKEREAEHLRRMREQEEMEQYMMTGIERDDSEES